MDAGDFISAGSAAVALLSMLVAFWNARSAKGQARSARQQAEAADHSLALAREQYSNQLEQQRQQALTEARDALVRIAMNLMEQGTLLKQTARAVRTGSNKHLAQASMHEVSDKYLSLLGAITSLPEDAKHAPATLIALTAIAEVQEGIRSLRPIVSVDPEKLDELGDTYQNSATRILREIARMPTQTDSENSP